MLLDEKDSAEGLGMLKKLALDEKGVAHDLSLYHLGDYYWHKKNFDEARNYWNQLILRYGKDQKYASPWVAAAKEKLVLIDVEVD